MDHGGNGCWTSMHQEAKHAEGTDGLADLRPEGQEL